MEQLRLLSTKRGGRKLVHNNYIYTKTRQSEINIYWYCVMRDSINYPGAMKTLVNMTHPGVRHFYGAPFVKICDINWHNTCMTCQVWYVACHVLYIYAMFHIFMPCFIYLCQDLYIYAKIYIFMPWFIYIYAMFYIFMPCFIYLCHVLYIYAMFYIFMQYLIYLCQFQRMLHHYSFMLHQDFHFCCVVFSHLCCINTNLCCINTTNLCCIKICQQFHFFHYQHSKKLSSLAVACGPTIYEENEGSVFSLSITITEFNYNWNRNNRLTAPVCVFLSSANASYVLRLQSSFPSKQNFNKPLFSIRWYMLVIFYFA